ncbi:uncharacterized protein [Typha latifolia]|uniref:uncharacterized protein n=1 Tax=Typha latifolia TaxID=4733 RepID=UPI003C2CBDBB
MASYSSEPTHHASGSGLARRPTSSSRAPPSAGGGPIRPDIEPSPRPKPVMQKIAIGVIVALGCLQFLPATHFRDPADPLRSWIPFDPNRSSPISTNRRTVENEHSSRIQKQDEVPGIHIFSWTNCLDLRVLAVLANSTLSSARYPEGIFLHFFVPEDEDEKLPYYKLKVVLPNSNIDITGQKDAKERLKSAHPEVEVLWTFPYEIAPLVIPTKYFSLNRYAYISPDTIIKGNIEDLFGVDLGSHAIGAAEDCSSRLGDYVNMEVLNAIQRTAAKSWISDKPYDKNACLPDLSILLVDPHKLEKTLMESILWWTKVLDAGSERGNHIKPAIALAFYDKYLKLPTTWTLGTSEKSSANGETKVLRFDGPARLCSKSEHSHQRSDYGDSWQQYISTKSLAILNH